MRRSLSLSVLPANFRKLLDEIFAANNQKCHRIEYAQTTGRRLTDKSVSRKTMEARLQMIRRAFADLWAAGYRVQAPEHLKARHIEVLIQRWRDANLSPAYIQTQLSALRVFSAWIGKPNLVKGTPELLPDGAGKRTQVAQCNLSWSGNGIDVKALLSRAKAIDERFGAMLCLQFQLGLRVKESMEIHPARVWRTEPTADGQLGQPSTISIWEGTKGGRQRHITLDSTEKRQVLEDAVRIAAQHPSGRLRWPGMTFKQAQSYFYRLTKALGITRNQLGVTSHGLRHQRAQIEYERRTGHRTPVEGAHPGDVNPVIHKAAALEVSQMLGHGRESVTASYYGSFGHKLRSPVRYTFSFQRGLDAATTNASVAVPEAVAIEEAAA